MLPICLKVLFSLLLFCLLITVAGTANATVFQSEAVNRWLSRIFAGSVIGTLTFAVVIGFGFIWSQP